MLHNHIWLVFMLRFEAFQHSNRCGWTITSSLPVTQNGFHFRAPQVGIRGIFNTSLGKQGYATPVYQVDTGLKRQWLGKPGPRRLFLPFLKDLQAVMNKQWPCMTPWGL